jgi:opacity protein-like surface antigen
MSNTFPMRFLVVALMSGAAWAQGIQNHDVFLAMGPAWTRSRTIPGTSVTLSNSWGASYQFDYGYQFARLSAVSLMVDFRMGGAFPGAVKANIPASGSNYHSSYTLGLRVMVPVNARLSLYAVSGGGGGFFESLVVTGGADSSVSTNSTTHGVFAWGGGADLRLSRWWSLRAEVRDFVTGRDLSGAAGRHHALPLFGVALHY